MAVGLVMQLGPVQQPSLVNRHHLDFRSRHASFDQRALAIGKTFLQAASISSGDGT